MKQVEDIKKIVKEMVDLTHSDDLNSNPLAGNIIVSVSLFRKCQS
jgi:hypothetical protein